MTQTKTHFDQIPLETVVKIVNEQLRQEETARIEIREVLSLMEGPSREQSELPEALDAAILLKGARAKKSRSI